MAEAKKEGQGRAVVLPNKQKRIEYIRNAYYNKQTGEHGENEKTRSQIKVAINEMLEKAGRKDEQIPYQIVFAATKLAKDPRIASKAAAEKKAKEKAEKEKKEKAEDDKKAKEKK